MQKNPRSFIRRLCIFLCLISAIVFTYLFYDSMRVDVPDEAVREPILEPYIPQEVVEEPQEEDEEEESLPPELRPRIVELRELYDNPDIVGFIEITGTNVFYPVVQTGNNVFYLYHDLHWNVSSAGSIFLDYENNLYELADDNTIIYGHNMRNGSKFHNIRFFHQEEFFRNHTYILLDTPYRETVWDIFSFFHTTTDWCYLTTNFRTREAFYEFLMELQRRSHFTTDAVLSEDDQILILSTCAAIGGDNRYVLVARLRQEVEEE